MHHHTNLPSRYVRYHFIALESWSSMSIPIIFQMLNLRRQDVYRDLSKHKFKVDEKSFAASEVCRLTKHLQWPRSAECTVDSFSKRYKISKSTVYHWKVIQKNPRGEFSAGRGRPTVIDKVAESEIIATLKQRTQERDALPVSAAYELINKVVNDTKTRQGKRGADASSKICRNTRKKMLKTFDIRMLAPQILTDARKKACECIRISYIWGCLLLAYSGNLSAENK